MAAYYTADYMLERAFTRQLLTYPYAVTTKVGDAGWKKVTTPAADVATVVPSQSNGGISSNGLTYTFHIRPGVMWNTSPARQVTASDFIREFKAFYNPVQPVGAPFYFNATIKGLQAYDNAETKYFAVKSHSPTAAKHQQLPELAYYFRPLGTELVHAGDQADPPGQRLPQHDGDAVHLRQAGGV